MDKLIILGRGEGWHKAPPDCETWGITKIIFERNVDMIFDIHHHDLKPVSVKIYEECKKRGIPYMGINEYPLDDILFYFNEDYLNSSVDYALAYAIFSKYTDIHLYGLNFVGSIERKTQILGATFWVGYAKGMGISVDIHGVRSPLLRCDDNKIYGFNIEQESLQRRN